MSYFDDLGLAQPILKALKSGGYDTPTPIQQQAIPPLLEGRDLCGIAQTGTGKTAAFALPSLHHFATDIKPRPDNSCRMLILSPTRELAAQIADKVRDYGKFLGLTVQCVFGGMPIYSQKKKLAGGVDVLVATPGRLLDLIEQRAFHLNGVEIFVLDEADQMMDMGFIHALKRIDLLLPKQRQSLFFSATMPKAISELAGRFLNNPVKVAVTPESTTAERVEQYLTFVSQKEKQALLNHKLKSEEIDRALIFTRTKHGADRVVRHLAGAGIKSAAIHGNKSQAQRTAAMQGFRHGHLKVLVATDIAARGIDVPGVSHVFNYELPNVPEQYVHRIGRTARAGADGIAYSFVADDERAYLKDIEKLTKVRLMPVGLPEGFREMVNSLPAPIMAKEEPQRWGRPDGDRARRDRPASRKPRSGRNDSQLMSRDGYGRDEIPVSEGGYRDGAPQDRQRQERPRQDRPRHDRQWQDRPRGDERPRQARSDDRPRQDRSSQDRPRQERPYGERQRDDRPRQDRAPQDRPRSDRSGQERSDRDWQRDDRPRSHNGPRKGNEGGGNRQPRDTRAPQESRHKRGGPPVSNSEGRNYAPKKTGVGKYKGAVKRAR
jgi:ATP-dependent RNA helicase RhlE